MTRRGIMYHGGGEANPIAATFTDRSAWGELTIAAYVGNTLAFALATALGKSMRSSLVISHPEWDSDVIVTLMQSMYMFAIMYAEVFAIGSWATRGVPFEIKVQPLLVLW